MSDLGSYYNICALFKQLGLADDLVSIDAFFEQYVPLANDIPLWEASWWNSAQAEFLHQALSEDANWQIVVDELNARLRKQ